jgi:hypothetical protein
LKIQPKLTHGLRNDEVWSCRFLWSACFLCMLPVAVLARLSGWRWRPWPADPGGYRSIVEEAKHASTAIAGTVFSV